MSSLGRLMAGALALGAAGALDTFEYITFTPPPAWSMSHIEGGRQYVRNEPSGVGLIKLLASRPATGTPAELYSEIWRTHATPVIPGPPPEPVVRSQGEVTRAVGVSQVPSQGTTVRVVVAVVPWRGRALGIVAMASGAQRQAELDAFFGTVRVESSAPTTAAAPPPAPPAGPPARAPSPAGAPAGQLGFQVPPGYVQQRDGGMIILTPTAVSERTPCIYGVAPPRAATGNLEADAAAALAETVVPGWRRIDDQHAAMRGIAAAGWQYVWYRAAFEGELGGQRQHVNAMAMVFPAGPGRVHVVWGMGNIAHCLLDDASFEQLFHSLRPAGWTSDGGQALSRALVGLWRYTHSAGLQQFTFKADGRYDRDLGSRAQVGISERTSTTATGGRFTLRDGEITLVPDHRPQSRDRYRVRLYDEWFRGSWTRAITLLNEAENPPLVIQYYRIDESAR